MPELMQRYLNDPIALGIAAAVAVMLMVLIVLFLARRARKKRARGERNQQQFASMEREAHFSSAADHTPYQKDAAQIASEIAKLFQEDLSVPVVAIYAGRAGADHLTNTLEARAKESEQLPGEGLPPLSDSVPSSLIRENAKIWFEKQAAFAADRSLTTGPLETSIDAAAPEESAPGATAPDAQQR